MATLNRPNIGSTAYTEIVEVAKDGETYLLSATNEIRLAESAAQPFVDFLGHTLLPGAIEAWVKRPGVRVWARSVNDTATLIVTGPTDQAPSVSSVPLPDVVYTTGAGDQIVEAGAGFLGTSLVFSLAAPVQGVVINPVTGRVTIDTDDALVATFVTVRAANSAGTAERSFRVTVNAPTIAMALTSPGTIAGTLAPGSVLSVTGDAFVGTNVTATYRWFTKVGSTETDIPNATRAAYLVKQGDIGAGKTVHRRITLNNGVDTAIVGSTAGVTIAPAESAAAFDPQYKGPGVVLSNSNKSAAVNSANVVWSAKPFNVFSPKFYAEVVIPAGADPFAHVGATVYRGVPAWAPGLGVANDYYSIALLNRRVSAPGIYNTTGALTFSAASGGVYRIAVDPAAKLIYFGTSAGWAGAAGTAVAFGQAQGFPLPANEEWFLSVCPRSSAGNLAFTLRSLYAEFTDYATDTALIAAGYKSFGEIDSYAAASTARAADDVAEGFGLCFDLADVPTDLRQLAASRLGELGVRSIRSHPGTSTAAGSTLDWFRDLHAQYGMKLVAIGAGKAGSPVPSFPGVAATMAALKTLPPASVVAVEGGNEVDNNASAGWEVRSLDAQKVIYDSVNAPGSPLAGTPVLGFTIWERSKNAEAAVRAVLGGGNFLSGGGGYGKLGDAVSIHYYWPHRKTTNGTVGAAAGAGDDFVRLETVISLARLMGGGGSVPFYVTEFGVTAGQFQYAPNTDNVTPEMAAKMGVRAYMTLLSMGATKAMWYCAYDSQNLFGQASPTAQANAKEFGLMAFDDDWPNTGKVKGLNTRGQPLRNVDGGYADFKRRPAFYAFKSLLAEFNQGGVAPSSLTGLAYALTGDLSDVRHLLLKRVDGSFVLALWLEAQSWNETTGTANVIAPRPVTLGMARSASSIRRRTLPMTATDTTWQAVATDAQTVALSVPDEVVLYEIII